MSRTLIPFVAPDISALARSLREQLANCDHKSGHVEILNMLARSTGHRNFQSLRAQALARERLDKPQIPAEPINFVRIERLARYFDSEGRLESWPAKTSLQELCLWVLWSKLPAAQPLSESELNRQIRQQHLFGDHALLRRELCDRGLLSRTADGKVYQRIERQPPAEAINLIRRVAAS